MIRRAYIGLGGNVGDRLRCLRRAFRAVARAPGIRSCRPSPVYETAPVGPRQRDFLNAALEVRTDLSPEGLLALCQAIERRLGRRRGRRWGPRVIDLDLLLVGGLARRGRRLRLPHPRWRERRFVLQPLTDLAPALRDPATGRRASAMLKKLTARDQWIRLYRAALE